MKLYKNTYIIDVLHMVLVEEIGTSIAVGAEVHSVPLWIRVCEMRPVFQLVGHPRVDLVGHGHPYQLPFTGSGHVLKG